MGILLKDQKVLYASENLGQIDVDDSPVIPTVVPVTSVMISTPSQYLGTEVGNTLQLTPVVLPIDATNKSVTWSSSSPNLAVVSSTGLVTRIAAATVSGVVVITATANNGVTGTLSLELPAKEEAITVRVTSPNGTTLPASAGSTLQLTATVSAASAPDKSVSWSSSNPSIATVSSTGLVTRTAPLTSDDGQPLPVTITARAVNGATGSIVLQAAVLQLPAEAFAVFDGIVGAREAIAGQWQDMSGNDNHMTIGYGTAEEMWGTDCLLCPSSQAYWGGVKNSSFDTSRDFTLSFLIAYDADAQDYDTNQGDNSLDCIACINAGANPRMQLGIGQRSSDYDKKFFSALKLDSSSPYETLYTSQAAASLSGLKLITFIRKGANISVYIDGVLLDTIAHTNAMPITTTPTLSFFATGTNYHSRIGNTAYPFNFFGQVYGVAVYNRALTATEVAAARTYYQERYNHYYTDSNES